MRTKQFLRNMAWGVLAALFALVAVVTAGVNAPAAKAEAADLSGVGVTTLFAPTAEGENYTVGGFGDWEETTTVEDYVDSPTGKVLHHVIDNTQSSGGETWPSLTLSIPLKEGMDATNYAGYIVWLEYDAIMYADSNFYGAFNFRFANDSNTVALNKPIAFVDMDGNISEVKTEREMYHHQNYTVIENSGYTHAYHYSFKGYMIVPADSLKGTDIAPSADRVMKFSHHYKKKISMDLKVGSVGFYTDYTALLSELGRCTYSFVDHDGTVIKTERVKPGTVVEAPAYENTFSKDGKVYSLVGWSGYTDGMTVTGDKVFHATYKARNFHMVEGASVRTNADSSGIRYIAEFDENLYNEVTMDDTKQFGMIITKYDYYQEALESNDDLVAGLNGLGGKKYVLITETSANPLKPYAVTTETSKMYRINGALTNIQYDHADWQWIGVGVVITTTSEGTEYLYCAYETEDVVRTMAYVASASLNNPEENFDEEETKMVKSYVYKAAAKLTGETEAAYNAQADKTSYLANFELAVSGGIDATYDFNANDGMKEAYLTIGEARELSAAVTNSLGEKLDVAYSVSVGDESVLSYDGKTLTALKNGYTTLTTSCELFGYSNTVMVYTGSENAGNRAESLIGSNVNASGTSSKEGEIDGQPYYWTQWQTKNSAHIFTHYSDISVYYIDYLLANGYKYLRIPFYFDTTRWEELGAASADDVQKNPYITTWIAKGFKTAGSSDGSAYNYYVTTDEWCYYDMDLMQYRMNYVEETGNGVDTYGTKLKASSYYQYMNMKFYGAYIYVYTGNMTFIKSSTVDIDEGKSGVQFADIVDLNDRYSANEKLYYTVDGEPMEEMVALEVEHTVEIRANVITPKIGDGNYTIGDTASWAVTYSTYAPIEKTFAVEGGIADGATVLVDVNGMTEAVNTGAYTKADVLEEKGFTVTESYVKRYSDQTVQNSTEIANTERGVFYATVNATNGVQTKEYTITLDLYNSTEAIEYESFGHADSGYAVKLYYYLHGALNTKSYDYLTQNYTAASGNGMVMKVGDKVMVGEEEYEYISLKKYGEHTKDTGTTVQSAYGYDSAASIYYLAIDQSVITPETPLVHEVGNSTTAINIYVAPRHSKAYYEYYAALGAGKLKYAYAAGWSANQSKRYSIVGVKSATEASVTYKDYWSANWQHTFATDAQTITPETIATYYESFCNSVYPFYISEDPHGRTATDLNNGMMKLSSLLF